MPDFTRRPLSNVEIAIGQSMFADEIDWPRIRIAQIPKFGFGAMVPLGETIVFSTWEAPIDFSCAPLNEQGWFVHELAHVWQVGRGVILPLAKLGALGKRAYRYTPRDNARLINYGIEAQAEIARHLFLARCGVKPDGAPGRDWLERVWPVVGAQPSPASPLAA